jgi:hypothetical protein
MAFAGKKPSPAINKRTVGRAQVFDKILAVMVDDSSISRNGLESSSSRSTSGNMPLSASAADVRLNTSIGFFANPSPRSIIRRASTRDPSFLAGRHRIKVAGCSRKAQTSPAGPAALDDRPLHWIKHERSLVWPRRIYIMTRESTGDRRSRTGIAGFGTLVEVVNDGGAGNGPSMVSEPIPSLSTALGG